MYAWGVYQDRILSQNYSMCWGHQCSPTWPSVQAGCPVWQLEIISFISYFALVTHISANTQTCIHTPKAKTLDPSIAGLGQHRSISPSFQTILRSMPQHALFVFQSRTIPLALLSSHSCKHTDRTMRFCLQELCTKCLLEKEDLYCFIWLSQC